MAYIVKNSEGTDVTQAFRNKEYSGSSIYNVKLTIKEKGEDKTPVEVPYNQIAKIVISSPIIDTTSTLFYVGSFISQQITITFRNLDNLPIASGNEVELSIGTMIDDEMVYVPMGKYVIDELAEDYYTKCEITCLDYGVKFKPATDIRGAMEQVGANYVGTTNDIFEYICNTYGVDFDENYPKTPNITTGTYDSTVSGKQWLSWIAETKGCNVKIDRDGTLRLVPLKSAKSVSINALRSKTWELGEPYKITRVRYELEGLEKGDTTGNTLYLRQDNPFIAGTREEMSTIVDGVYDVVKDTEIYSLKNENIGDITLDAWDIIEFTIGENTYLTINDNTTTFEQSIMTKIEPKIPTTQQQEVVNVKEEDPKTAIKTIKREINTIDATITDTITKVDDNTSQITTIRESIDGLEVNFQKSGNNLVRNTMFYDTEGWTQSESFTTFKCDTIPEDPEDGDTWWCTSKVQNYEENKIYLYDTNTWVLSNLLVSDISKTNPLGENLTIESSSDTKQNYLSGRALNITMNGTGDSNPLSSEMFDISPYEDKVTLSFRHTTSLGAGWNFAVDMNFICYDDEIQRTLEKTKYTISPSTIWEDESVENTLVTYTYDIPKITNAEEVYYSETAPTDTTVAWLAPSIDDDTIYLKYLYDVFSEQWVDMSSTEHLIDQNGNIYLPTTYMSEQDIYNAAYKLSDDNTININKAYIVIQLLGDEENPSTCQIGDIKVEYGDYTEWSPKRTEVMGLTHLLDETGYKIHSGDDEMRIMVDEIAQYYKETKTFWLNKYGGYMKNALSDTTNVDGLITTGLTVGSNKLYGRYVK